MAPMPHLRLVAKRSPPMRRLLALFLTPLGLPNPSHELLQKLLPSLFLKDRWSQAKQSAQNPKHVKIEKLCSTCLLRTLGGSSMCRGCHGDLTSGMKILPGQWPPLNCPDHLLQRFEDVGTAAAAALSGDNGDVPMASGDPAVTDRPILWLSCARRNSSWRSTFWNCPTTALPTCTSSSRTRWQQQSGRSNNANPLVNHSTKRWRVTRRL